MEILKDKTSNFSRIIDEKNMYYEVETEVSELNEYGCLKPYGFQHLFARVVDCHLEKIEESIDTTMQYNLGWVLMSMSFEIKKPITGLIKLHARTWFSQHKGPYYRREFEFFEESGQLMCAGTTFSVLFDLGKRSVYRHKEPPFLVHAPLEEFAISAVPSFKEKHELAETAQGTVKASWIDSLGHVNNTRYGELCYDAFSEEEMRNLGKLKRMDFYFSSEMRYKDEYTVSKGAMEANTIIKVSNRSKADTAFYAVADFSE